MTTMFLSHVTVVDHAYINDEGFIIGGSFNPNFKVSGEVDPHEQVVIDFSKCKKQIKALIDDNSKGMDHKLWILPSSKAELTYYDARVRIITPHTEIDIPASRIYVVDSEFVEYSTENAGKWFENYVNEGLAELYKDSGLAVPTVECVNDDDFDYFARSDKRAFQVPFRYTHGLKNSSSWGCRSPVHGHFSFICGTQKAPTNATELYLYRRIAKELENVVFIHNDNVKSVDGGRTAIEYFDEDGVKFSVNYSNEYNIRILPHETTIEHLVEYIADEYGQALKEVGVTELYVSEGLNKGAVIKLKE